MPPDCFRRTGRAIDLIARFLNTIRVLVNEHDAPPLGDKRARKLHPDETRSNDNDLLHRPIIPPASKFPVQHTLHGQC